MREEKLKLLSDLLGQLSFPPPSLPPTSSYSLVYVYTNSPREKTFTKSLWFDENIFCKILWVEFLPLQNCMFPASKWVLSLPL